MGERVCAVEKRGQSGWGCGTASSAYAKQGSMQLSHFPLMLLVNCSSEQSGEQKFELFKNSSGMHLVQLLSNLPAHS